jgi:16S rRNA (guanine527-N7)-methyltransferase
MNSLAQRLCAAVASWTQFIPEGACRRLAAYAEALLALNEKVNLTAARSPEQMLEILLLPSLGLASAWTADSPPKRVLDLGSGNGFPGMAAAVLWPASEVTLVERRAKKVRAIDACIEAAGIENAHGLACDAREVKNECARLIGGVDLVTVRAVGPLDDTTALAAPFLAPGGRVIHWKGLTLTTAERGTGAEAAHGLGLTVLDEIPQPGGRGLFVTYARPAGPAA